MKKVISLVLCVVMVASLFVINVSAAVPIQKKMTPVNLGINDGDTKPFVANATLSPASATAKTVDDGGNLVYEMAYNGKGALGTQTAYILFRERDFLSGWWSDNFEIVMDVKAINNKSGITFSIDDIKNIIHVFPAAFAEDQWITLKLFAENKNASLYVKAKDAPDSEYRKLIEGVEVEIQRNTAISSSASYFGIDARYINKSKCDVDNFMEAKYYVDNLTVTRFDNYASYGKNFVLTDDVEITVNTEEIGATGFEYKFPVLPGTGSSSLSMVFDVVRSGGDRPIHVMFDLSTSGYGWKVNLFSDKMKRDVKYTVKADYEYGSLKNVAIKEEGTNEWVNLTSGTDYSSNGVYGKQPYIKIGYLGQWCYDTATDAANLEKRLNEYCGGDAKLDDVNTQWTFSNFQVSYGYVPAISAIRSETATGHKYTVSAVGQSADFAVMIAVYDGETFAGAGVANFNHEGVAEINVDHSIVSPTFKAFIWNTANESAPMMAPIDITTWVE